MSALPKGGVNSSQLLRVLSTSPVKQGSTKFTAVMSATTGEYSSWIQGAFTLSGASEAESPSMAVAEQIRFLLQQVTGIFNL